MIVLAMEVATRSQNRPRRPSASGGIGSLFVVTAQMLPQTVPATSMGTPTAALTPAASRTAAFSRRRDGARVVRLVEDVGHRTRGIPDGSVVVPGGPARPVHRGRGKEILELQAHANRTELDTILRLAGVDNLVLGGIATDVAVESTVRVASDLGYRTIVVSDACTADSDEAHAHSLDVIQKWFGETLTADEVVSSLDKTAQRAGAKHAAMAKPQISFTGRRS
jgi:nicotinamidase-related amidase